MSLLNKIRRVLCNNETYVLNGEMFVVCVKFGYPSVKNVRTSDKSWEPGSFLMFANVN